MFNDLDSTLAELLRRELPPEIVSQVSITFAAPGNDFPPASVTLPAIDLFLHELTEHRELRASEAWVERSADGAVTRTPPPLRVDCRYLVTAWGTANAPRPEEDEHRLLGEALRVLHRHRELPREALQGSLKSQAFPVRTAVLAPGNERANGDFWQALGGKPRAAFSFTVTIAVDPRPPEDAGRVVLSTQG
jgi:hypothetical protein